MVFTPKLKKITPQANIHIQGQFLEQVESCKFLGVILDNRLNWAAHMKYLSNKVAKSVGILSKIRKYLNRKLIIAMYYAFIYPLLLYCNICWGNATQCSMWWVFRLKKNAVELLCLQEGETGLPHSLSR